MDKRAMCSAALLAAGWGGAWAGDVSAPLPVQVTVPASCRLQVESLDFGVYQGQPLRADASVAVICQAGLPYRLLIDEGLAAQGVSRRLSTADGTPALPYTLRLKGPGVVRGGAVAARLSVDQVGTGERQAFRVQGALPGGLDLPPGAYRDVVQVTVQF